MSNLPDHLFCSSSDGSLYDTRDPTWSRRAPLRAMFRRSYRKIATFAEVKAALRYGAYAWSGGYPLYFVAGDGESISFESVRESLREVCRAMWHGRLNDDWRIIGCEINYEDSDMVCAHSGKPIECANRSDENDTDTEESSL